MSRSSIFSSRTLVLSDGVPPAAVKTALLALLLIVLAEGAARVVLRPIGAYWEYWTPAAAAKFETYRQDMRSGSVPHLVVVGDSTAARDIDPARLVDGERERSAFNLAWPANFPLAFRDCTLPLLRSSAVPQTVVASFSPTGFLDSARVQRFEAAILASPYCRQLRGEKSVADRVYLTRVRLALPLLKSYWIDGGLPRPTELGFMPLKGVQAEPDPGEEPNAFASPRFAAVQELFEAASRYGFAAVIVVPPRLHPSAARLDAERTYVERLREAGFQFLDYRNASFLRTADFYDGGHLNRDGARVFSAHLASDLRGLAR